MDTSPMPLCAIPARSCVAAVLRHLADPLQLAELQSPLILDAVERSVSSPQASPT